MRHDGKTRCHAFGCHYEDHNVKTGIVPVITASLLKLGFRGAFLSFGATS
jgi:hypothetical protein